MRVRILGCVVVLIAWFRAAEAGDTPRVVFDGADVQTPFAIGIASGTVEGPGPLRLAIDQGEVALDLEAALGTDAVAVERVAESPDWLAQVRARLEPLKVDGLSVDAVGPTRAVVRLPASADLRLAEVIQAMTAAPVSLRFQVEVLPRERYRPGLEEPAPRLDEAKRSDWPWQGTAEEFDAFREAEIKRWREARDAGTAYVPSRSRVRLVKRREESGQADDFALVEEPSPGEAVLDESMIASVVPGHDERGSTVVLLEIAKQRRTALRDFTARNRLLPLAILLDGELVMAPVIQGPLEDRVEITLGTGTGAEAERQAAEIARGLRAAVTAGGSARPRSVLRVAGSGRFQVTFPLSDPSPVRVEAGASHRTVSYEPAAVPSISDRVSAFLALHAWMRSAEAEALLPSLPDEWSALLEKAALEAPFAGDRRHAFERLGDRASDAVLLRAVEDADLGLRDAAIVRSRNRPGVVDPFVGRLLREPAKDEAARTKIVQLLSRLAPQAERVLIRALTDPSEAVRARAVEAGAADWRTAEGVHRFLAATRDPSAVVRRAAFRALRRVFEPLFLLERFGSAPMGPDLDPHGGLNLDPRMLEQAIGPLSQALTAERDPDAAVVLSFLDPRGIEILLGATESTDAGVREIAFGALGPAKGRSPRFLQAVDRGMKDPEARVRLAAALSVLLDPPVEAQRVRATEVLLAIAADTTAESGVRISSLLYPFLVSKPGDAERSMVERLLKDPDDLVRRAAVLFRFSMGGADEATERVAKETVANPPPELLIVVQWLRNAGRLPE